MIELVVKKKTAVFISSIPFNYERKTAQYYNYTALETMQGNLSRSK